MKRIRMFKYMVDLVGIKTATKMAWETFKLYRNKKKKRKCKHKWFYYEEERICGKCFTYQGEK